MCVEILVSHTTFRINNFSRLTPLAGQQWCRVFTDGLRCFTAVAALGFTHIPLRTSGDKPVQDRTFKWVNTMLGNVKSALVGTYRAITGKHVPRYLSSFAYRFNRRFNLEDMFARLAYVAIRTPPMPYRLLKLAENCA